MKLLMKYLILFIQDIKKIETPMKGSSFMFHSVQYLCYKCHKVNFKRAASYIDTPDWIKKKKATINPKNTNDECFQYAVTLEEIESHPERISNIKSIVNIYNWKGISHPSK